MKSIRSRGFTLIELLVVIAIIGLLASIILASLNTARMKGRDAARVAALKEIGNLMEASNNGTIATAVTCTTAPTTTTGQNVTTCTVPSGLSQYTDPSGASGVCAAGSAQTSPCAYSIYTTAAGSPTTQNYKVCTYLESGSGGFSAGSVNISAANSDSITSGC
jgi:prepilin-type N-terminal cleavage/methylation domain-containing protein